MDQNELKEIQGPLKDRYRSEPATAVVTLRATSTLDSPGITC